MKVVAVLATLLLGGIAAVLPASAQGATPSFQALSDGSRLATERVLKARGKRLIDDTVLLRRVRKVSNSLNVQAEKVDERAYKFHWNVYGMPDPAPDALVFPDGRLLFTDGLVSTTGFADDELAAIIAQQLAHVLLGHVSARLDLDAEDVNSPDPNRRAVAVADRLPAILDRPDYTRDEIEAADRLAIQMIAKSGFDPRAAGSAWRRLDRLRSPIVARQRLSEQRLIDIDAMGREAVPLFEEARKKAAAKPAAAPAPGPRLNKPWASPNRPSGAPPARAP